MHENWNCSLDRFNLSTSVLVIAAYISFMVTKILAVENWFEMPL